MKLLSLFLTFIVLAALPSSALSAPPASEPSKPMSHADSMIALWRKRVVPIDERYARLGKDSLLTSEMFYVMKPYFEFLRHEDPHYRVSPIVPIDDSLYKRVGDFDRLMSIFIDRPTVRYCSGQRVMVSNRTLGFYDFLKEEMAGQVIELPADEYVSEFETVPKMYVGGLDVYVMMSRNTGSIAASFCNMLQYNDAARLVGEPLMHNALKYGETVYGKRMIPVQMCEVSVSTVEIDEYTRAVDGVLMPDIPIPYVAADYLDGGDAMLDRLLEIIARAHDAPQTEAVM